MQEEAEDDSGDTEEWDGLPSPEPEEIDHEAEYIDEDKFTTVTVEAMDVSKEGLFKVEQERNKDEQEDKVSKSEKSGDAKPKRTWTKEKPSDKAKKKRKNFRYESKAERQFTRKKQKLRNSEQARERRAK